MASRIIARMSTAAARRVGWVVATLCSSAAILFGAVGRPAYTLSADPHVRHSQAKIPAFARKYGLACSACHTVWPELNAFGQAFKDNGYQLGNDRDSPIYQSPGYFPIALRTTPQLHLETTNHQPVDAVAGDPASGQVEKTIRQSGFDLSGVDLLMIGTLYKNISFGLVPTLDPDGSAGIEAAFVRFDNLANSPWMNVKVGKFELDNLLSEKRILLLSNNGGFYQNYHFAPPGSVSGFGLGDNQLGAELMGHSSNSYTRYSLSVLQSTDGEAGLAGGNTFDAALSLSQAFSAGGLGIGPQRIGVFGYFGRRATTGPTADGEPIPGAGTNAKTFYRAGATAQIWLGSLELLPVYLRGSENAYLATGLPGDQPLPSGARDAVWNAGLLEAHYIVHPQLAVLGRYESIRMSRQAIPDLPSTLGDVTAYTAGVRAYPFMFSRDGMALHLEYSLSNTTGAPPLSGNGVGLPPLSPSTKVMSSSVLLGFDFAF